MSTVTALPAGRLERARGLVPELGFRSTNGATGTKKRTLHGKMVPFNVWAEIDSVIEGHFMEQFLLGSLDKTFSEGLGRIRCIFHHGQDKLGKLVLGRVTDLHCDADGAYYEVELFDGVEKESPLLIEGIESGEYGTSMFFEMVGPQKEDFRPGIAAHNPQGIPERRIIEAKVIEFGPTPFAVYPAVTAGLRSLTDEMMVDRLGPEAARKLAERSGISLNGVDVSTLHSTGVVANTTHGARAVTEDFHTARRYKRAAEFVGSSVWLMEPGALATVLKIIGERIQGHRPDADEIAERIGGHARAVDEAQTPSDSVRVIDISGPLVPHAGMMTGVSTPGRAIEDVQQELRAAVADETVKSILLNVNSPGGSARMIPELAAELRDARKVKPVVAVANTIAASGGYYLAAQADELVVTPSGQVGSVGAYMAHEDISALEEKAGIKTTLISAGDYKVEGNPFEPLTAEARVEMQSQIDEVYKMFVNDVAKGRDVTVKKVEADFGQGRMVMAAKAVELGMADRVATFDQTLARLEKLKPAPVARAAALDEREPERSTHAQSRRTRQSKNYLQKEKPKWQL